ncbi:FGGY-family carbohydrate kinase [Sulfitobacter sp. D35]|uniref:FGGY-family carbohydrate kinase n=1 Tax=Sulfitobacter sp. D35 TaxID=3083252 RepID=UPI00296F4FC9|nr:FGGY-family carbohydrate kinase [Sulfitobacter sp. D35]MDW4498810.1 FGGY-family carbohydrate kinase [Sulfitobacter sp. D35]
MSRVAVIDIGKTNAKLALVDLDDMSEIAVVTRPNTVRPGPPWPHFDLEGHWEFLLDGLAAFHRAHGIDAISVTTHGASIVLLDKTGRLAAPMLDYEHDGPDEVRESYDALRPDFAETGSPRLPAGLNVGAQLHWMLKQDPGLRDRIATVVTYPQYWGFRLTGVAATDCTSLGCHTDLWVPSEARLSALPERLGLGARFAPTRAPSEVLGPLLPQVAARTGLPAATPVHCGIHDSNASLLPHVLGRKPPFSVVSTGTWVVCMGMGGTPVTLDPKRDTLINVNALGDPVPSARFMGGRAFDLLCGAAAVQPSTDDLDSILAPPVLLLPAVVPGSGPYPDRSAEWIGPEPPTGSGARTAAASLYLALMTAECLDLIGHNGTVVVAGPFARNDAFCKLLSVATESPVARSVGATGTSQGAALLATGARAAPRMVKAERHSCDRMQSYARAWRDAVAAQSVRTSRSAS